MKKEYIQPNLEVVKPALGERLCNAWSPTGDGQVDPETGDNHFGTGGGGAPFRFPY